MDGDTVYDDLEPEPWVAMVKLDGEGQEAPAPPSVEASLDSIASALASAEAVPAPVVDLGARPEPPPPLTVVPNPASAPPIAAAAPAAVPGDAPTPPVDATTLGDHDLEPEPLVLSSVLDDDDVATADASSFDSLDALDAIAGLDELDGLAAADDLGPILEDAATPPSTPRPEPAVPPPPPREPTPGGAAAEVASALHDDHDVLADALAALDGEAEIEPADRDGIGFMDELLQDAPRFDDDLHDQPPPGAPTPPRPFAGNGAPTPTPAPPAAPPSVAASTTAPITPPMDGEDLFAEVVDSDEPLATGALDALVAAAETAPDAPPRPPAPRPGDLTDAAGHDATAGLLDDLDDLDGDEPEAATDEPRAVEAVDLANFAARQGKKRKGLFRR